jgi:hypothetical protein
MDGPRQDIFRRRGPHYGARILIVLPGHEANPYPMAIYISSVTVPTDRPGTNVHHFHMYHGGEQQGYRRCDSNNVRIPRGASANC